MSGRGEWWLCPNTPRCGHGRVLHDSDDDDERPPTCCVETCGCGQEPPVLAECRLCEENWPIRCVDHALGW